MKTKLVTLFLFLALINLYPQIGGYALNLDGSDDYIDVPDGVYFDDNTFTIEAWVYLRSYTSWSRLMDFGNGAPSNNILVAVSNSEEYPRFQFYTAGDNRLDCPSSDKIPLNVWTHIACVLNGTNGYMYINGKQVGTAVTSGDPANIERTLNYIAKSNWGAENPNTNMKVDEFRIWSDSKSVADIKTNMFKELSGNEANLVLYYKMSNGSSITLTDNKTGGSNHGTISGGESWIASGCFSGSRQALDFDGSDDYVDCIANDATLKGPFANLTLEVWVKPSTVSGDIKIFGKHKEGLGNIYNLGISEGRLYPEIRINTSNYYTFAKGSIPVDKWTHLAVTYAKGNGGSNGTFRGYINGELIHEQTDVADVSVFIDQDDPLRIGAMSWNASQGKYTGQIDEIRIWNSARSQDEIRNNMMTTLSGDQSDLVAYYRFDHYDGTTLYDNSGRGHNGTLTNMDPATDWVASSAFNTWIGSESNVWNTAGNWSKSSAPSATDNVGLYKWNLGSETEISGTPTMNHLLFSSTASPTLSSNFTVNGYLVLQKDIDLNGRTITLGSSGYLSEGNYRFYGVTGSITTTRDLSNINNLNVAGLGATITENDNLGSSTITRNHSSAHTSGIERQYQITTSNAPSNATLVFNYLDTELNGVTETNLDLFKSADGINWTKQNATLNITDNTLTLSGINSFSYWTAGDKDSPLPVELNSFTASISGKNILLNWQTETETNNYGFEIERSTLVETGHALSLPDALSQSWDVIGFVAGSGNSNSSKDYAFTDKNINSGKYQYRLKQIDNDGAFNYSKVIEVEIENTPSDYSLSQNYPNPFNPSTTIRFGLPENSKVVLEIYNLVGEKVATLINGDMEAGYHDYKLSVNEYGLSSGIYFYKLSAGDFTATKKLILMK